MTPVDQTVFEDGRGNCLTACIATILDISIDDVPNFITHELMYDLMRAWLKELGWSVFEFIVNKPEDLNCMFFNVFPATYCIMGGKGPRTTAEGKVKSHAVVARLGGWGVDIVHDTHPSRAGLLNEGYRTIWVLTRGLAT